MLLRLADVKFGRHFLERIDASCHQHHRRGFLNYTGAGTCVLSTVRYLLRDPEALSVSASVEFVCS